MTMFNFHRQGRANDDEVEYDLNSVAVWLDKRWEGRQWK